MNSNQLDILQIVLASLLIIVIILQNRGAGLSVAFGGSSGGESYRSRRGFDKLLLYATIILGILFVTSTILSLIVAKHA